MTRSPARPTLANGNTSIEWMFPILLKTHTCADEITQIAESALHDLGHSKVGDRSVTLEDTVDLLEAAYP